MPAHAATPDNHSGHGHAEFGRHPSVALVSLGSFGIQPRKNGGERGRAGVALERK